MIVILIFIAIFMISVILSFVIIIGAELYDATEDIREEIANKIGEKIDHIVESLKLKIEQHYHRGDNCKSMLTFPLKKEWYEKIKSGEKTIEYREVKPYWTKRIVLKFFRSMSSLYSPEEVFKKVSSLGFSQQFDACDMPYCALRLGYTRKMITASISQIEVIDGKDTDLHIDKPVYAIHLANVTEVR